MLRRTIMRRAYNGGNWEKAREIAFRLESNKKEQHLARSIILRSYWNQNDIEKFLEFNQRWGNMFPELEQKAQYILAKQHPEKPRVHLPRITKLQNTQPSPKSIALDWNPTELEKTSSRRQIGFGWYTQMVGFFGTCPRAICLNQPIPIC